MKIFYKNSFLRLPLNLIFIIDRVPVFRDFLFFNFFLKRKLCMCCLNTYSSFSLNLILVNLFCFFVSKSYLIINYYYISGNFNNLTNMFLNSLRMGLRSISYGYYISLQLIGFRYRQRWFRSRQLLKYTFGLNKRVWFKCPQTFVSILHKIAQKKRNYYYFSFHKNELINLLLSVKSYRSASIYTGIGFNVKTEPLILKEGKKSIW
jgi:hypothetical protein